MAEQEEGKQQQKDSSTRKEEPTRTPGSAEGDKKTVEKALKNKEDEQE